SSPIGEALSPGGRQPHSSHCAHQPGDLSGTNHRSARRVRLRQIHADAHAHGTFSRHWRLRLLAWPARQRKIPQRLHCLPTLRGELLELWLDHKIPTRAMFIVTHNIEEAVVLADRIIVLGRNPAHIHADFTVSIPHPRDRKSAECIELVDSIYRVLTHPAHKDETVPPRTYGPGAPPKSKVVMLPHTRPGG